MKVAAASGWPAIGDGRHYALKPASGPIDVDVLQKFLSARLFDVSGDDSRVARLREAAADLAERLKSQPQRVAIFTMVAIDDRVRPDEPLIVEVAALLEKRWQSYAGAFADAALPTVGRAIILQGLSGLVSSDAASAAVSLTARSLLPHLGAPSDRVLWTELLDECAKRLDLRAQRDWALPSAARATDIEPLFEKVPAIVPPTVDGAWLSDRLLAASGPTNKRGETLRSANQLHPNQGQPWSHEFAPAAASAISAAVDALASAFTAALDAQGDARADAMAAYVRAAAGAMVQTAVGLERRTSLLWWNKALYSPAAGLSYRGLEPAVAAALVAIDASAQTGGFAPRMAEAVVRETARAIDPAMLVERPLADLAAAIPAAPPPLREVMHDGLGQVHVEVGRIPLAGAIFAEAGRDPASLADRVGLEASMSLTPVDLCVWLFRDLQAAAATPPPVRRKRQSRVS